MEKSKLGKILGKMTQSHRSRIITALMAVVVFATTYSLILPAITLTKDKRQYDCHYVVHEHTDDCYVEEPVYDADGKQTGTKKVLVCGRADYVAHQHDENCYQDGKLVCQLPEIKAHVHTKDCYKTEKVLTCGLEETKGHKHTDSCYTETETLVCTKPEHTHTDDCYSDVVVSTEQQLVCGYEEGEEISPAVWSEPEYSEAVIDPETGEVLEEAQLIRDAEIIQEAVVHHHDDSCYETIEHTERQLTCGMDEHTHDASCYETERTLTCGLTEGESHKHSASCYTEQQVLKCTEYQELHTHTMECYEKGPNGESPEKMGWAWYEEDENGNKIVVGDYTHRICGKTELFEHQHENACFSLNTLNENEDTENETVNADETESALESVEETDDTLMENETIAEGKAIELELPVEGADYSLRIQASAECGIPEDASFKATALKEDDAAYQDLADKAQEAAAEDKAELDSEDCQTLALFDLSIYDAVGNEIQPKAPLSVQIVLDDAAADAAGEASDLYAVHFPGTSLSADGEIIDVETEDKLQAESARTEVINAEEESGTVSFEAEGFSVYAVVYTVDFEYEVDGKTYEYSIPGGGCISLSNLVETLNVTDGNTKKFMENVTKVTFSDTSLVWVGKTDVTTTVKAIKEKNNLESLYSLILPEEEAEKIDATEIQEGDWALISLLPFASNEHLTVTMANGDVFTVKVTDDQNLGGTAGGSGSSDGTLRNSTGSSLGLDDVPAIEKKDVSKTLTSNGDGTYTLELSVKIPEIASSSSNKANIVVIFDSSNSMHYTVGDNIQWTEDSVHGAYGLENGNYLPLTRLYIPTTNRYIYNLVGSESSLPYNGKFYTPSWTRLHEAKNAAKSLGSQLLAKNDGSVEVAFIEFGTDIFNCYSTPTKDIDIYNGWVDACETYAYKTGNSADCHGATNWEMALDTANNINFNDDDPVYIVFITDGNPTCRTTEVGEDTPRVGTVGLYGTTLGAPYPDGYPGVFGTGNDDTHLYNINQAAESAAEIRSAGKTLYTVSIYGDASGDNLTKLNSDALFECTDLTAMNEAFSNIANSITARLGYNHVSITDGLTGMTSAQIAADGASASDFTYKVVDADGTDITATALTEAQKNASFTKTTGGDGSEKGTVQWDLGDGLVINGATYSVSFVVWPDQDAYDLVADLNNETITYDSLKAAQKKQITGSEGSYSLNTNTSAKVDYTPAMEVTTNGETQVTEGTPGSINMDPPNPMPLTDTTVKVQKKWNVSLSPKELTEFLEENPNYKVQLTLKKNTNSGAVDFITGITIDPVSGEIIWPEKVDGQEVEHHISTGLMVSAAKGIASGLFDDANDDGVPDDSKGYTTTTYEGTTYYILEKGWDYYFEEVIDRDYHFEFEKQIYHPMVVDGEEMDVTFNEDGTIASKKAFNTTLSAVNILKGGINVQKKIQKNGAEITTSTDKFTVEITMLDPDGNAYKDFDYRIYYGVNNPNYSDTANYPQHRTGHIFGTAEAVPKGTTGSEVTDAQPGEGKYRIIGNTTGVITEELYVGDVLRVVNVPSGVTYKVEETEVNGTALVENEAGSYQFTGVYYEISIGSADNHTEETPDEDGFCEVQGNSSSMATVINEQLVQQTGSLKITKTVKVNGNVPAGDTLNLADGTYTFQIWTAPQDPAGSVQVTKKADGTTDIGDLKITVANGVATGSLTVDGLAPGTYVIKETGSTNTATMIDTSVTGYDTSYGGIVVTVSAGDASGVQTAAFTNKYDTTEATVKKVWDDNDNSKSKRPTSLTVTLYADGVTTGQEVTLNNSTWSTGQTVSNLPKYKDGAEINYYWVEGDMPVGYFLTGTATDGTVTTLTNTLSEYDLKTSYTGTKTWVDESNKYSTRPAGLVITLQRRINGSDIWTDYRNDPDWVKTGDTWTYTFDNIPVFDENGNVYYYQAVETTPGGYTPVTTNTPTSYQLGEITYLDTKESHKRITPNNELIWNLGSRIDLAFSAVKTTSNDPTLVWTSRVPTPQEKTAIENELEKNILPGYNPTLKWISGNAIGTDSHGSITFSINEDTNMVKLKFTKESVWAQFIMGQFNGSSGNDSSYEIGSTNFKNTLETTTLEGTKTWIIEGETVPADPILTLTRSTAASPAPEVVTVKSGDNTVNLQPTWTDGEEGMTRKFTYSGLPKYDASGNEYNYAVTEYQFTVDGVTYTVMKNQDGSFTATPDAEHSSSATKFEVTQTGNNITNAETSEFEFSKIWKNETQETVTWPEGKTITVNLNAYTDSSTKAAVLTDVSLTFSPSELPAGWTVTTSTDGKTTTFKTSSLAKFKNGKELTYYVVETQVNGYNAPSYAGSDGVVIINADRALNQQQIINTPMNSVELPSTGGPGTGVFTFFGGLMCAFAGFVFLMRRRKA